jgi:hypothetical protein
MAIFVEFDDGIEAPNQLPVANGAASPDGLEQETGKTGNESEAPPKQRENPNRNAMTEALGCYP